VAENRGWLRTETLGHAALSSPQHPASSQPSPPRVISSSFGRSAPPRPNACLAPAPPGPAPPSPNTFCAVEKLCVGYTHEASSASDQALCSAPTRIIEIRAGNQLDLLVLIRIEQRSMLIKRIRPRHALECDS
jgi:hypothetical protein